MISRRDFLKSIGVAVLYASVPRGPAKAALSMGHAHNPDLIHVFNGPLGTCIIEVSEKGYICEKTMLNDLEAIWKTGHDPDKVLMHPSLLDRSILAAFRHNDHVPGNSGFANVDMAQNISSWRMMQAPWGSGLQFDPRGNAIRGSQRKSFASRLSRWKGV